MRFAAGLALLLGIAHCAWAEDVAAPSVYVARRGWHIDVGYAVRDLREPLRSIAKNDRYPAFILRYGSLTQYRPNP